jgi:lipopolysaccharide transport system ATP-binding protein
MSDIALKIENLSKKYYLRHQQGQSYTALRDVLAGSVRSFGRKLRSGPEDAANLKREEFWALKDVSFEVKRGEAVGIIGRNGAGKSTLLKILSRITPPTTGKITGDGRVASLLEVGTGFHPELTGRENIYLNGAILGMSRTDIKRKFDEIVDFAEVEKFLDTPVKRYSSGMYVRLAFAVAAHLEPEILVVDEVLAVGDAAFQKKCLGKMNDVATKEGRTVLFVSHSMPSVQQLCTVGIVLDKGRINFNGNIREAISVYTQQTINNIISEDLLNRLDRSGSQSFRFSKVTLHNDQGRQLNQAITGQDLILRFHYISGIIFEQASVNIAFNVYNSQGFLLTNLNTKDINKMVMPVGKSGYFECSWPYFNLRAGLYTCNLYCEINNTIEDWLQAAFQLNVEDGDFYNSGYLIDRSQGDMLVSYNWTTAICESVS